MGGDGVLEERLFNDEPSLGMEQMLRPWFVFGKKITTYEHTTKYLITYC
jgi:hypothetical protein